MLRPTLLAMVAVLLIQVLATLTLSNRRQGAMVALTAWPWLLAASRYSIRPLLPKITPTLNGLSLALMVAVVISIAPSQVALSAAALPEVPAEADPDAPDIWLILLDGYPRGDTLSADYSFANDDFFGALEERGFDVAAASRSNYNQTILTLTSMLSMRHVVDIPELSLPLSPAEQYRSLSKILSRPPIIETLSDAGYHVTSIPSPFLNVSIRSSRRFLDTGHLTWFEMDRPNDMATDGPLGRTLAGPLAAQHRDRIADSFEALSDETRLEVTSPRFVFAHVMAPHAPFLFGPNGEERELPTCFPKECDFWAGWVSQLGLDREAFNRAVTDQVQYVNHETLDIVDAILREAKEPPVIVVMSDHGSRLDPSNPDEMFRNLFAAYTPGHPDLFGEETTPISLFPRILSEYLDIPTVEPPPDEYINWGGAPLDIQPYVPPSANTD